VSRRWNEKTGTSTVLRHIKEDGGPEAWERFVHRYWRVIHGYAIACGLPPGDAEDLTQVVLTELVEKLPDFEVDKERGTFRTVLRRLVRWRVTDALRVVRRDRDAMDHLVEQSVEAVVDGPDEIFERAWREGLMKAAMTEVASAVAPEHYQAFEMTAERDMPAKEVASMLGMSTASVYKAKSQISKQIRETFDRLCAEAD
tara:strand:+ start:3926 stop:4525 length:600 start_codon:yes stop_codon:yes gene_type:complete